MMVVYLHGFRSSPQSTKARLIGEALGARGRSHEYWAPSLPASPKQAVDLVLARCASAPEASDSIVLIGSSLGGYYATWLAEHLGCRAVLLNPGVFAARDLARYVGTHSLWHDATQTFELTAQHIDGLRALEVAAITRPERYFLVAATGDEVIDWRDMVARYPGAKQKIIQGSDHGISDFADHIDEVLEFCGSGRDA